MRRGSFIFGWILLVLLGSPASGLNAEEEKVKKFVDDVELKLQREGVVLANVRWNYESNITAYNQKIEAKEEEKVSEMSLEIAKEGRKFNMSLVTDFDLQRKMSDLLFVGMAILPQNELKRFRQITTDMGKIFATGKVPAYKDQSQQYGFEPNIKEIMGKCRDPKELEYYWDAWRKATGPGVRKLYPDFIKLVNKAARLNGMKDGTEYNTKRSYDSDNFPDEIAKTWAGLKPLYEQIHAYVRHVLGKKYGADVVGQSGPIPAHLLGNMWAQNWANIVDLARPYPNKPDTDVTEALKKDNWTVKKMFQKADEFFQSMGMYPMPESFWKKTIMTRPSDGRDLTCHASAWNFHDNQDYRIKMCGIVDQDTLVTVHHEMGHVEYYLSYRNQSYLYQGGANPGFHEAVADTAYLSVSTTNNMQRLGLIDKSVNPADHETDINVLFNLALHRLVFLPFGYLVDKFRWDLYSGVADFKTMNCHWWKLRLDIQGISPPNQRSEMDFDPAAKYHIAANVNYIRYFTAHIYQFQFYKALCLEAGQYVPGDPSKPLHRCNFYGSKAAGAKFISMLKMGSSKPWHEAMRVITGQPEMDTQALREYFSPLEKWLRETNAKNNVTVGWKVDNYDKYCTSKSPTDAVNV